MGIRTGLIGEKLPHSLSPYLHSLLGDPDYSLIELNPDELERYLLGGTWDALNVTIPYKKAVIPYCGALTDRARQIGAANSLVRRADGVIVGDNTDFAGFCELVRGIHFAGRKVAILGSGGAGTTVTAASLSLGAREIVVISRLGNGTTEGKVTTVGYSDTDRFEDADILVNATPVGMYPDTDKMPIDLSLFGSISADVDLIYNPLRTRLILDARRRGIGARSGLRMLCAQAVEARRFFGCEPEKDSFALERQIIHAKENVVFVGMPGSGKSTIARLIAERYKRKYIDTDALVIKDAGLTIPDIFAKYGEARFRELERKAVAEASSQMGAVIATGGGSILDADNCLALRSNGFIIWLDCPPKRLATGGRPLSSSPEAIEKMYRERHAIYRETADVRIAVQPDNANNIGRIIGALEWHYKRGNP